MCSRGWKEKVKADGLKCNLLVFLLQAEDGIRDAQESRGLGDVYKRQQIDWGDGPKVRDLNGRLRATVLFVAWVAWSPVSYTHLTLPTTYSV